MKILAADIGGTNSRFAHFEIEAREAIELPPSISFPTRSEGVHSFLDLVERFEQEKTSEFESLSR